MQASTARRRVHSRRRGSGCIVRRRRRRAVASSTHAFAHLLLVRHRWGRPGRCAAFYRPSAGPAWSPRGTSGRWDRTCMVCVVLSERRSARISRFGDHDGLGGLRLGPPIPVRRLGERSAPSLSGIGLGACRPGPGQHDCGHGSLAGPGRECRRRVLVIRNVRGCPSNDESHVAACQSRCGAGREKAAAAAPGPPPPRRPTRRLVNHEESSNTESPDHGCQV